MIKTRKALAVFLSIVATVGFAAGLLLGITHAVTRSSDAQTDLTAYGHCMDFYHDPDQCQSDVYAWRRVDYGTVSDAQWDNLMRQGWRGVASDGREALYPPVGS